MTASRAQELLDRLAQGPLPSSEFASWAASRKSLHVRIHRLVHVDGHRIVTRPDPDASHKRAVVYVLEQ